MPKPKKKKFAPKKTVAVRKPTPASKKTKPSATKAKSVVTTAAKPSRRLKQAEHRSFRLSKRKKSYARPILGSFRLMAQSLRVMKANWKLFLGIFAVYVALTIVLVHGFSTSLDVGIARDTIKGTGTNQAGNFVVASTLVNYLLDNFSAATTPAGATYQALLMILITLVLIWTLREILSDKKVRIRDGFYKGTYPFVPFLIVLVVVGLELVPLLAASWLYSAVVSGGIVSSFIEKAAVTSLVGLFALLSLYLACSSLFALYIVTLKDTEPIQALRVARRLVLHRRWMILRKVLFLPMFIFIVGGIIMFPVVLLLTPIAEWTYFVLTMSVPFVINSYMYMLYRELL